MFALTLIFGCYSYAIFFLGLLHLLYKGPLLSITAVFVCLLLILGILNKSRIFQNSQVIRRSLKDKKIAVLALSIIVLAIINLAGVLGPELSFDALWYHLTLPKIYLLNHKVFFIHGNLLYYSAMPQLTEMYYVTALALSNEIVAKIIHFLFGILSCVAIFFLARKLLNPFYSLLAVVVFYANLVVGWESITAFVDLTRTFFEIMALWGFLNWIERKEIKWALVSGVMIGFGSAAKLLSLGDIGIFLSLFTFVFIKRGKDVDKKSALLAAIVFLLFALLVVTPWLLYSYQATGNPVYPFFSSLNVIQNSTTHITVLTPFIELWNLFVMESDPILPIYLIVFPLLFFYLKKRSSVVNLLLLYSGLSLLYWYALPKIGGGRFVLPYLPVYSILIGYLLSTIKDFFLRRYIIALIFVLVTVSLLYRTAANAKYLPVIFGKETKQEFLRSHLNFSFGDFYDTDNFFANHIKSTDMVLLYGFHNLYYVNFPFIHESWLKKGDKFNYIAVQNGTLPEQYRSGKLIHEDPISHVKVYSFSKFISNTP